MNNIISNPDRAQVLIDTLPYLKKYSGKTVVVKYGGNAMTDEKLKSHVMEDLLLLWLEGVKVVLVHGGGPDISDLMKRLGKKPEFVNGLRVTDLETVEIVEMALAGKVNKSLVSLLQRNGAKTIGLSGVDGLIVEAEFKDKALGYVGNVIKINTEPITTLLENGYLPVIATLGADRDGNVYNINGDTTASHIAGALKADKMIMMTDIAGVMRDPKDPTTLIPSITVSEAKKLKEEGVISGGMIPKIDACLTALNEGVGAVCIMDGRTPHSILTEILTASNAGTTIVND